MQQHNPAQDAPANDGSTHSTALLEYEINRLKNRFHTTYGPQGGECPQAKVLLQRISKLEDCLGRMAGPQ